MKDTVTLRTIRAICGASLTYDTGRELLAGDIRWPMYAPQISGVVGADQSEIARRAVMLGFGEAPWTREQGLEVWASICGRNGRPEPALTTAEIAADKTAPT